MLVANCQETGRRACENSVHGILGRMLCPEMPSHIPNIDFPSHHYDLGRCTITSTDNLFLTVVIVVACEQMTSSDHLPQT